MDKRPTKIRKCRHPGCNARLPPPSGPGRPAERCDAHRGLRPHRRTGTGTSRLSLVPEDLTEPPAADPEPADPFEVPEQEQDRRRLSVAGRVRADLDELMSAHPVADTLTELAVLLAETLDQPATRVDPSSVAKVSRELRAVLADLVDAEAADDDPLGLGDAMPSPVVIPPSH